MAPTPPGGNAGPAPQTVRIDFTGNQEFKSLLDTMKDVDGKLSSLVSNSNAFTQSAQKGAQAVGNTAKGMSDVEKAALRIKKIQQETRQEYKDAQADLRKVQNEIDKLWSRMKGQGSASFKRRLGLLGLDQDLVKAKQRVSQLGGVVDGLPKSFRGRLAGLGKDLLGSLPGGAALLRLGPLGAAATAFGALARSSVLFSGQLLQVSSNMSLIVDRADDVKETLSGMVWEGKMSNREAMQLIGNLSQAGLKADEVKRNAMDFHRTQQALGVAVEKQIQLYTLLTRQIKTSTMSLQDAEASSRVLIRHAAVLGQQFRNMSVDKLLDGVQEMAKQMAGMETDAARIVKQFSLLYSAAGLASLGLAKAGNLTQDMVDAIGNAVLGMQQGSFEARLFGAAMAFPGEKTDELLAKIHDVTTGFDLGMDNVTDTATGMASRVRQTIAPIMEVLGDIAGGDIDAIRKARAGGDSATERRLRARSELMTLEGLKPLMPVLQNMGDQNALRFVSQMMDQLIDSGNTADALNAFITTNAKGQITLTKAFDDMLNRMVENNELTAEQAEAIRKGDTESIDQKIEKNTADIAKTAKGISAWIAAGTSKLILGTEGVTARILAAIGLRDRNTMDQRFMERREKALRDQYTMGSGPGGFAPSADNLDTAIRTRMAQEMAIIDAEAGRAPEHHRNRVRRQLMKELPGLTEDELGLRFKAATDTALVSAERAQAAGLVARGLPTTKLIDMVSKAASTFGLSPTMLMTQAWWESGKSFDPAAVGDGGASIGLMQVQLGALTDVLRNPTTRAALQTAGVVRGGPMDFDNPEANLVSAEGRRDAFTNLMVGAAYNSLQRGRLRPSDVRYLMENFGLSEDEATRVGMHTLYNAGERTGRKLIRSDRMMDTYKYPSHIYDNTHRFFPFMGGAGTPMMDMGTVDPSAYKGLIGTHGAPIYRSNKQAIFAPPTGGQLMVQFSWAGDTGMDIATNLEEEVTGTSPRL